KEITLTAASADATALQTTITAALTAAGSDSKYTTTVVGSKVAIEAVDKTADSPKIEFVSGVTAATYGETSFVYDANNIGEVSVGGQNISTGGGNFDSFVASLQEKAEAGGYTVNADAATKRISLVSTTPGGAAPTIEGIRENGPATAASRTFSVADATALNTNDLFGEDASGETFTDIDDVITFLNGQTAAGEFGATYKADKDSDGNLVISTLATGASAGTPPAATAGLTEITALAKSGTDAIANGIDVTRTAGTAGSYTTEVEAASHKVTLTYGNKSADINIVGRDTTSATPEADQLKLINDQLKAAGLSDIEASFDADDKLVFTAKTEEAKTLAVSGESNSLFGTKTVSTGTPAVSAYKATNAVDQFVEEINRNSATNGYLRASNDNGKLRIENLSTQALNVEFDKDGAGGAAATSHTIGGNAVREGLAKQFNELKDQLNKLADDASFNGINLLRGDQLTITFNETGNSFMQIKSGDDRGVNSQSLNINDLSAIELDSDGNIDALLGDIKTALNSVRSQASAFGSNLSIVQNRQDFTKNMINTLQTGAANLTLADMNEEAANLLALQTRQSLSSSALSMASQADQSVLQLLR
ncbi:flagellin, partial [Devosia sp.]|uniref:flagellin n=1 Tax=Devosia sp. TaxID=1871048 RepID=UPI002B002324